MDSITDTLCLYPLFLKHHTGLVSKLVKCMAFEVDGNIHIRASSKFMEHNDVGMCTFTEHNGAGMYKFTECNDVGVQSLRSVMMLACKVYRA